MNKNEFIPAGGSFPLKASELKLSKYVATGTLSKGEDEEAAVRLLTFSQQEGQFVGVPWNQLMLVWAEEYDAAVKEYTKSSKITGQFHEDLRDYRTERKWYIRRGFFTLGISLLFSKTPVKPVFNPPTQAEKDYFSITISLLRGPKDMINAIWRLIENGLIVKEFQNETDYLFPTPALVQKITKM